MMMLTAACAARCGSSPTAPPPPPPVNHAPTVTSVTPGKSQVEAGNEVTITAIASDPDTAAASLQYTWSAEGGTFTGTGASVTWKSPTDGPVPHDYVITVRVSDPGGLTATGTSAAIRVNDAVREMRQLALTFFADFMDVKNSPTFCVRNFTDSCPGKGYELGDITRDRIDFDQKFSTRDPQITKFQLHSGYSRCTYPSSKGGAAACALLVASVDWQSRWSAHPNDPSGVPGTWERVIGDAILTGVYEKQQWWLCDSYFEGTNTLTGAQVVR